MNEIWNADAKLKVAVIKLFLDNFEVLAMHPSQYGETNRAQYLLAHSAHSSLY